MSTRANIKIKNNNEEEINIYHHHDGYLSSLGFKLLKFIQEYIKENKFADCYDIANALIKIEDDEFELTSGIHGDEEYYYTIDVFLKTLSVIHSGRQLFTCNYLDPIDIDRCIKICNED